MAWGSPSTLRAESSVSHCQKTRTLQLTWLLLVQFTNGLTPHLARQYNRLQALVEDRVPSSKSLPESFLSTWTSSGLPWRKPPASGSVLLTCWCALDVIFYWGNLVPQYLRGSGLGENQRHTLQTMREAVALQCQAADLDALDVLVHTPQEFLAQIPWILALACRESFSSGFFPASKLFAEAGQAGGLLSCFCSQPHKALRWR